MLDYEFKTKLIVTTCLTVSLVCLLLYRVFRVPKGLRKLPRVSLIRTLKDFYNKKPFDRATLEKNRSVMEKHHIAAVFFQGSWHVAISSMEAADKIFKQTDIFPKALLEETIPGSLIANFIGNNVVFSNGLEWKRHRQVVNPPFKKAFDPSLFANLANNLFKSFEEKDGQNIEICSLIQRLTIDALGIAAMGIKFNSLLNPDVPFINNYNIIVKDYTPLVIIFRFLETPNNPFRRKVHDAVANLSLHFQDILSERRNSLKNKSEKSSSDDLLTLMLMAKNDGFSDKDIRDNVMIFLVAGQDTTAMALCTAMYFLAVHPHCQEKLYQEINEIVGCNLEAPNVPTHQQLRKMPYLSAFLKETLRLYPPVARLPTRVCTEDVELEGHFILKGSKIVLETLLLQRDPEYWENPDKFDPTRFMDDTSDDLAWYPFGGGSRLCLGLNFSLLEQKVILVTLLQRYVISTSVTQLPIRPAFLMTVDNLKLNFTKRTKR